MLQPAANATAQKSDGKSCQGKKKQTVFISRKAQKHKTSQLIR